MVLSSLMPLLLHWCKMVARCTGARWWSTGGSEESGEKGDAAHEASPQNSTVGTTSFAVGTPCTDTLMTWAGSNTSAQGWGA